MPEGILTNGWWYIDDEENTCGPIQTGKLAELFQEGAIDGLTVVTDDSKQSKEDWRPISQMPLLRKEIALHENFSVNDDILLSNTKLIPDVPTEGKDVQEKERSSDLATSNVIIENQSDLGNGEAEATLAASSSLIENRTGEPNGDTVGTSAKDEGEAQTERPNNETAASLEARRLARKRRRVAKRLKNRAATSVYVTGLPMDVTESEVATYFSKCGIILPDGVTGRARVKLYEHDDGKLKGDALITYALAPSVENAITLLDGVPLRYGGTPIHVQRASFDHKDAASTQELLKRATGDGAKRPQRSASQALVQNALSWADDERSKATAGRIVILQNVFDLTAADYDVIRDDMQEGCAEYGDVEKITVFERSDLGAVAVRFATAEAAKECVRCMNGRWYDRRLVSCAFFDGVTDYRYKGEDDEAGRQRDGDWEKWLENESPE